MRSNEETSVEIPKHAAYDEAARQLGLPDTAFHLDHEENILHYRYLANEVYRLRNFLTLKFGQFEGPAIPHAMELLRILGKIEPPPPERPKQDPGIVKACVKHHLKDYFSQPHVIDTLTCLDDLCVRFGIYQDLGSQYLIEAVQEGSVRQIGNLLYGKGQEPILEAAVKYGRVTKTHLIEKLARIFGVGEETMAEELGNAITRNNLTASYDVTCSGRNNEYTVTPVSEKRRGRSNIV